MRRQFGASTRLTQRENTWGAGQELLHTSLALITDDIFIIVASDKHGIAFVDKEEIPVVHLAGEYYAQTGYLGEVVEAMGDGAVLRLNDDSLWSVPGYDQYHTGWWLPPYKVLVTASRLYMINLEETERVWVKQIK